VREVWQLDGMLHYQFNAANWQLRDPAMCHVDRLWPTWTTAPHVNNVDLRVGQQLQQLLRACQPADATANHGNAACAVHW
jgi:hypothetical protein